MPPVADFTDEQREAWNVDGFVIYHFSLLMSC